MKKDLRAFFKQQNKLNDKLPIMLTWYITDSGTVSFWLQQGESENYRLTDINGRLIEQGDLKNGRVTFMNLLAGTYTVHIITAKGTLRKELII